MTGYYISMLGLIVGVLVGMTGVGGGAIMTPALIIIFNMNPLSAVGTDLFHAFLMKIAGSIAHLRHKTVDLRVSSHLIIGGVPGTLFGVYIIGILEVVADDAGVVIKSLLGFTLILVACFNFFTMMFRDTAGKEDKNPNPDIIKLGNGMNIITVVVGFFVGLLVGLSSVGSGVMILVFLLVFHPIKDRKVVGTDIVTAAFLLASASIGHQRLGTIDYSVVGLLLMGSVPGIIIGSKVHAVTPIKILRQLLSIVILVGGACLIHSCL